MKNLSDYLDEEFIDFLREMPPEMWVMQVPLDFLNFWKKEFKYLKKHNIEPVFHTPESSPKPNKHHLIDTPITDKEIEEFEKFLKGIDKRKEK